MARFELPVISIVLNNSTLAWTKHSAMRRYPRVPVSQDFTNVDFATCARAMGAVGHRVSTLEALSHALTCSIGERGHGPCVIEVLSSPEATPVLLAQTSNY